MEPWGLKYLFYGLFQALRRESGIELDLRQYTLLVEAFGRGIGADANRQYDEASLLSLCKTLWLTHPRYELAFEQQFRRFLANFPNPFPVEKSPAEEPRKTEGSQPPVTAKTPEISTSTPSPPVPPQPLPEKVETLPTSGPQPKADDMHEWQVAFDKLEGQPDATAPGSSIFPLPEHRFIFSDKYFPVEERKLQHHWRHLRYRAEKKTGRMLDLPGTIRQTAKRQGDPQLVFLQENFYEEHFLFLMDRGGSMCAFEKFSDKVLLAMCESIRPQQLDVFYFHDLPDNLLYKKPELAESLPAEEVFNKLNRHSLVFIFSDAGAARGGRDKGRTRKTLEFLQKIQSRSPHLIWFNPVPQERWPGSPAFYIPLAAHVIELSESNLNRLPQLLKHF